VYAVKVSGRVQPVRLIAESPYGGWVGRNEHTGREIRMRSAAKLRARLESKASGWLGISPNSRHRLTRDSSKT
jgi:hypothetical protein